MRRKSEIERVWLLCGVALAALFLLKSSGIIFQGAISGLGMFTALYVLFSWFPTVKNFLFSFGGVVDLLISFGLPLVMSKILGVTGGTMLMATITCGLLFTFTLTTRKLGGPLRAASKTGALVIQDTRASFALWRKECDGSPQVGGRRARGDRDPRGHDQCEEVQEASEPAGERGHRARVIDAEYTVN